MSYLVLNKDSNYPIPLENWIRSKKYYNLFPVEGTQFFEMKIQFNFRAKCEESSQI